MKTSLKALCRFAKAGIAILFMLQACGEDSGSDKEYEDPRFLGYMEAKVNGVLKVWPSAFSWTRCEECDCFDRIQSGYVGAFPDVSETIVIRWDVSEEYGCRDLDASYAVQIMDEDGTTYFGSRDLCEDEDPITPATYICHDVSFNITSVGNDIYRGTFSFVASRNCGEEEVVITDGKFEVKILGPLCDSN